MAILAEINTELKSRLQTALTAAIAGTKVGTEWPPNDVLQDAGSNGGSPVVAIIHRFTNYKSLFDFEHSETTTFCGISGALSDSFLGVGQSIELTVGYSQGSSAVNPGDMIGFNAIAGNTDPYSTDRNFLYASYTAVTNDTLASVATNFATAIHAAAPALAVTVAGPVITITNNDTVGYSVKSKTGEKTMVEQAVSWADRNMQIMCWSGNLVDKFALQNAIEQWLVSLNDQEGFALPTTEWIMLKLLQAKPDDAQTDKGIYCDIFLFSLGHFVDVELDKWSILATDPQLTLI